MPLINQQMQRQSKQIPNDQIQNMLTKIFDWPNGSSKSPRTPQQVTGNVRIETQRTLQTSQAEANEQNREKVTRVANKRET